MRKFYICFPIATTVSSQLSWSHYLEILKVDEEPKRNFYIKETINFRWSVRELQRQIGSLLYERLLLSTDKNKVLELAEKGHELKESKDLVINSRNKVYQTVNTEMLSLYWNIGKAIMEIQQGDERASYGETVLKKLSQKLTAEFRKGFSKKI